MTYTYFNYPTVEQQQERRKSFNILIVDDDLTIANSLKTVLNFRGHNVTVVDDGIRCITQCQNEENHFDIVFLDYHMDGLDGARVAEIVKDKKNKSIIFAYTGDNSDKALKDFKSVGMDGAIIKPVDINGIDLLMNKLENCVTLDKSLINMIARKSSKSILIFDDLKI
jgi:CheY-like chemotaxis protein